MEKVYEPHPCEHCCGVIALRKLEHGRSLRQWDVHIPVGSECCHDHREIGGLIRGTPIGTHEASTVLEHTECFTDRCFGESQVQEPKVDDSGIERAIVKRQGFGIALAVVLSRIDATRFLDHIFGIVDSRYLGALVVEGTGYHPCPTRNVEHPFARLQIKQCKEARNGLGTLHPKTLRVAMREFVPTGTLELLKRLWIHHTFSSRSITPTMLCAL